ncbi:hypothetical protein RJ639_014301 [Escallonia herrerae]|uniref:Uncharacterized protein n=1 Tax=Escallonia herrerae TaxID=1293975 RepID=A0AA88VHY7_9ASTE|nr:hypothetical protein RJ639_014301 [Escallonia herrerae]
MGGVCSGGTVTRKSEYNEKSIGFSGKLKSTKSFTKKKDDFYPDMDGFDNMPSSFDSGELKFSISRELKPSTPARKVGSKAPQGSSFLGKAGNVGLEVLDTLGSSMSNLNVNSGFLSNMASRGNKISILSFEVANTIAKGANLLQTLSEENIQFLKKDILHSEGVQQLVSTDIKELLCIAAADKREEFDVFSREVIRFGDLCKDPQWHNLGRFFERLDSDPVIDGQLREEAEMTMQELTTLAQHTSELYHELNALDRFEQDYRRKLEEVESLHLPRRGQTSVVSSLVKVVLDTGESLMILQSELKHQRKLVRSLKKKSLWSKSLEEVVEKLVDIVSFIHQEILEAFGDNGLTLFGNERINKSERLGVAGLALHYANIITQIDNIASRPTSLPPNMRDTLYNGLPCNVKAALRSHLQTHDAKEKLTVPQIKVEMEKTLQWLVPVASDTTKAHQGFGWVGEWANTGNEFGKKTSTNSNLIRLQTLYHADKQKMDRYILELVTWLHRLISTVRNGDNGAKTLPFRSPTRKGLNLPSLNNNRRIHHGVQLSSEDRNLLEEVMKRRRLVPGVSKSQEFVMAKKRNTKVWALSRSTGSSPRKKLEHAKASILDVLDGLDTTF